MNRAPVHHKYVVTAMKTRKYPVTNASFTSVTAPPESLGFGDKNFKTAKKVLEFM